MIIFEVTGPLIAGLFCIIGKFKELSYDTKKLPGRIALRRKGIVLLTQPAAGGEFCDAEFYFISQESN